MRWYFEYLWRLFGTALSFVVFGIGGLVYGLLIFPLVFVFVRDRQARRVLARRFIGKGFGAFLGLMKWVNVVDIQVEGREYIDDQRRQLIIANHPTLIDVVILISLFPQANCVIKQAVTLNPFMRSTVRAADYISNSEPARACCCFPRALVHAMTNPSTSSRGLRPSLRGPRLTYCRLRSSAGRCTCRSSYRGTTFLAMYRCSRFASFHRGESVTSSRQKWTTGNFGIR
jgi:hypothetical protein